MCSIVDVCPQLTGTFPKNIIVNGCSEKIANGALGALQSLAGELPAQLKFISWSSYSTT